LYTHNNGDQWLLVGVYVDDLIITGGNQSTIEKFKVEMKVNFKMTDLGLQFLKKFQDESQFQPCYEVKQGNDAISLS
jgi:hypothetical protein